MGWWATLRGGTSSKHGASPRVESEAAPVAWRDPRLLAVALAHAVGVLWGSLGPETDRVSRAYIDPGSGSLLLQLVASFFVGLLFYLRGVRRFFASLFSRRPRREPGDKTDSEA